MGVGSTRQSRLSLVFKGIFWGTMVAAGIMLTWLAPALTGVTWFLLVGFAVLGLVGSIGLDIARGTNVVLWTALTLIVGAAILGLFFWIHYSFAIAPPSPLFNFAPAATP